MSTRFENWPHVIRSQQFTREWLEGELFPLARNMRRIVRAGGSNILGNKRMVSLFWQPSSRTRGSFQFAMDYLGGQVTFATENAAEFSSAAKGESIGHTIRVFAEYGADVIVMRHKQEGAAAEAARVVSKYYRDSLAIINAGDGLGQHPTQGFLDVFSLMEKFGKIDGMNLVVVGDLRGRAARSFIYQASLFDRIHFSLISCKEMRIGEDIKAHLRKEKIAGRGVTFSEGNNVREVARSADACYVMRSQKEYEDPATGKKLIIVPDPKDFLRVDRSIMHLLPKHAVVEHPLPIDSKAEGGPEIDPLIEDDPRVICFKEQIMAGLLTRMALLKMILAPEA